MAAELKILFSEEDNTEFDIEGVDIKTKINNLTQRYRTERKTMGPSGGKRPEWKLFDKINKILGSLPCNDASLIHESMEPIIYQQLCQPGTSTTTISSEDESGSQYDINVLQNVLDTNFQSESSKASTSSSIPSCATATPIATRKKRSRKYKPYEEIDRELLNEIKRSNDLTELEIKQNDALRLVQERCLLALERTANCLYETITKKIKIKLTKLFCDCLSYIYTCCITIT
ncbi:hypothetical protein FQA39_LY15387 [Lamprigera yunnana]|nr:hypothetical protein FQA39_LY15387 [Lamprigera yunnana]